MHLSVNQQKTHRVVCGLEAAPVIFDCVGGLEDIVEFSPGLDGNISACRPHQEERTRATWRAASLSLRHTTFIQYFKKILSHLFILFTVTFCPNQTLLLGSFLLFQAC